MNSNKDRKWQITLTEEQMRVMTHALEDWHRFVCGECAMTYATSYIDTPKAMHLTREILDKQVREAMFPELKPGEAYSWDGGHPNPHLSCAAAISYLLYREIRHQLAVDRNRTVSRGNVYEHPTLTCAEQGPMIDVRPLADNGPWRIVDKELPDIDNEVLVAYDYFDPFSFCDGSQQQLVVAHFDGEDWYTTDGCLIRPSHWMPIPQIN